MLDTFLIEISSVVVDRASRQRRDFITDDLEASISRLGVLNPIIIDENNKLIAGERRLAACIALGHETIPARCIAGLCAMRSQLVELDENVRRSDLTWQELTLSILRLHEILCESNEDWSISRTSAEIGYSEPKTYKRIQLGKELRKDPEAWTKIDSFNTAVNALQRKTERRASDALSELSLKGAEDDLDSTDTDGPSVDGPDTPLPLGSDGPRGENSGFGDGDFSLEEPPKEASLPRRETSNDGIIWGDFVKWAPAYAGQSFNFIHCDFPFGIEVFAGNWSGRNSHITYDDSYDTYMACCNALFENLDALLGHSGHIMFWFSMEHYERTLRMFAERAPFLAVQKFPLIWTKTDNAGIAPDPKRQPRRIYETALIATREDRPLVKCVSNWYGCGTDKTLHHSCKPEPMLRNFFRMFVDDSTRMLDPTAGSGSALRAAESLGAAHVLGLEANEEYAKSATRALEEFRVKRRLSEALS